MEKETTNGYKIIVDDDFEIDKPLYYDKSNGYVIFSYKGKKTYLHRFVLNAQDGDVIDHINKNKLDNRNCNLRKVSHSLNNYNKNINNKLGRGIYLDKSGNRYRACISQNNKTLKLGSFKDINEAKKAYNKKAFEIYGNDAYQHEIQRRTSLSKDLR